MHQVPLCCIAKSWGRQQIETQKNLNEKETIEKAFKRISDIIECNNGVREADYIGIVSKAYEIS
jgi:hypothetical protein